MSIHQSTLTTHLNKCVMNGTKIFSVVIRRWLFTQKIASPVVFTAEKVLQCRQKNKKGDNVIEDQGIYNESFSFNLAHVHLIVQYLLLQSGSAILKKISGLEKCSASFEFSDWLRHFFQRNFTREIFFIGQGTAQSGIIISLSW